MQWSGQHKAPSKSNAGAKPAETMHFSRKKDTTRHDESFFSADTPGLEHNFSHIPIYPSRSRGTPIDSSTQSFMSGRFGADFSDVKIHTDNEAVQMSREISAKAFAIGNDIYFNAGQYQPGTTQGKHLLAHELTHTLQHRNSAGPKQISRTPDSKGGTQAMHEALIEQYRQANGFPPHGKDPVTGQQIGPTDSEIRFGGLLDEWLKIKYPPTVPAPAAAPKIAKAGTTNVVGMCQNSPNMPDCRTHQNYILNIYPAVVGNIGNVSSPYSAAIAAMYKSVLPKLAASAIPPSNRWTEVSGGALNINVGPITHNFTDFSILLQNAPGGVNGMALSIGGPKGSIMLNEASDDALLGTLPAIEQTMVHEATHVLASITEDENNKGAPGAKKVNKNLDKSSYGGIQADMAKALLPYITQIGQLPSFAKAKPSSPPEHDATFTAGIFINEIIARTEAGIYAKQREGQAFSPADLRALPVFINAGGYWSPTPPLVTELDSYIKTNQQQIDAAVLPFVFQAGEKYLSLRP
jgi:Domain of unknown function (DUF4157)